MGLVGGQHVGHPISFRLNAIFSISFFFLFFERMTFLFGYLCISESDCGNCYERLLLLCDFLFMGLHHIADVGSFPQFRVMTKSIVFECVHWVGDNILFIRCYLMTNINLCELVFFMLSVTRTAITFQNKFLYSKRK